MAVKVTQAVADGLEAVRSGGKYNMFDRQGVMVELMVEGYLDAAEWVEENPKLYTRLIFEGLEVSDNPTNA